MAKVRWLKPEEREIWRDFTLMQFQLFALLGRELADEGLSYQDYVVLADLTDSPESQARLSDLGRDLGWEKSRVSHHVTRMAARGLVVRTKCPTDQRGWFVVLTDAGRQAMAFFNGTSPSAKFSPTSRCSPRGAT